MSGTSHSVVHASGTRISFAVGASRPARHSASNTASSAAVSDAPARDHGLDVFRMLAEREARHLDLVALHPVLVAADRVDLAIMGEAAERLREPPLREGVGRIALVEDRDAALEQLVREVGKEVREALGEEQALVDDRARRQAADIEVGDLRRDHLLLDPAADEIKLFFELGDRSARREAGPRS